jgi:lipoyl(octanoyl) transferase
VNREVEFRDLGLMDYQEAWDYQDKLFQEVIGVKLANRKRQNPKPTPNYLLFCQHNHVYTQGKSGKSEHLLLNREEMRRDQVSFFNINRGGDITYHGPGQIVGYPILDLENFFTDIHRYLRTIEASVILTLADYGLDAGRIKGLTGVWLDYRQRTGSTPRKICALGVRTSRWVTLHGFAFIVNTDLNYFNHIVPCGIDDKDVTSMARNWIRNWIWNRCLKGCFTTWPVSSGWS